MGCERADGAGTGDDTGDHDLHRAVAAVMARIVAGERAAVWDLHDLAEPALARMLRAEGRRIDVWLSDDDVLDLTLDAAIDLARMAHAWRPDGAPPWVWAHRRIAALVHDHAGTFARPLDERDLNVEQPALVALPAQPPREVLRRLARHHPSAHSLDERLDATVSERDAAIWLGVVLEGACGNRSPAVTVGADHDLRPETVRKVVQRVRERIGEVA